MWHRPSTPEEGTVRLAGILALADIDRGRFDVLRQRDQLPFYSGPQNEAARTHRRFTIGEAFALRLMLDLIGEDAEAGLGGVPPSYAHRVIPNALARARDGGFRTLGDFATGRVLIGAAILEERGPAEADRLRFARWIACRDDELGFEIAAIAAREKAAPVRLLIVNAARAAQDVIDRARALGINDRAEDEPA
jgi:hypothetical protein